MSKIDFEAMEKLIDSMYEGNVNAIKEGLEHKGCFVRINAILSTYENKIRIPFIIQKIQQLTNDENELNSVAVGDYAKALLHLYGMQKYDGVKKYVKYLIDNDMEV